MYKTEGFLSFFKDIAPKFMTSITGGLVLAIYSQFQSIKKHKRVWLNSFQYIKSEENEMMLIF